MTAPESQKKLVLVGGGHTHALLALQLINRPIPNSDAVMVSDVLQAPYSGMLPGLVAGVYRSEDIHIDLVKLCNRAGIRLVQRKAVHIDPASRVVKCSDGTLIPFDLISIDVGSTPSDDNIPGVRQFAIGVKPVPAFLQRWREICERPGEKQIAIVGGGAGGCEIALAARERLGMGSTISIFTRGKFLLGNRDSRASRLMLASMQKADIKLYFDSEVKLIEKDQIHCRNGAVYSFSDLIWLTQAGAPAWFKECHLPLTKDGFLQVENSLQIVGHPGFFAVGDCSTMIHQPQPKAGVYAVRQAPILMRNIRAQLSGDSLIEYRPQKHFLSLMKLNGQSALAQNGFYTGQGHFWWTLKDWIDRRFMRLFQKL
jgi:selenide,water dikinase